MLVSHSHKFIFIKTRKVGGSSVEKIIVDNFFDPSIDICTGSPRDGTPRTNTNNRLGHIPWNLILKEVGSDVWNSYYKFTIERNPWDKIVSQYYWKAKGKGIPFEKWLEDGNQIAMGLSDWGRYSNIDEGKPVVDQVILYHNLHSELIKMFKDQFNLDLTQEMLDNTNCKSGFRDKKHYTEVFQTQQQIDKIANLFVKEVQFFNFIYGEN